MRRALLLLLISSMACGTEGPPGATGEDGASVLVTSEPPGAHCVLGGVALSSASGVSYVCHGHPGYDGVEGPPGPPGVPGAPGIDATAPVGAIVAFAGEDAPPGWLLCNGAAISRLAYDNLYAAIGSAWGAGDGTTTFNLPDLRGRFLRGADRGTGRDPDAASRVVSAPGGISGDRAGSLQADSFRSHAHAYSGAFRSDGGVISGHIQGGSATAFSIWGYDAATAAVGNSETRPVNVSVNYIVKY